MAKRIVRYVHDMRATRENEMLKHNQVYKRVRLIFGSTSVDLRNVICWIMEDCTILADYTPGKQSLPIVTFEIDMKLEIISDEDGLLLIYGR